MADIPETATPYAKRLTALLKDTDDTPYFAALGRFIASYSVADNVAFGFAVHISGLEQNQGRVMLNSMRLGEVAQRIRGLLRLKIPETDPHYIEVDACLTQLDTIAAQRNKMVHRVVSFSKEQNALYVSNMYTAKSLDNIEWHVLSLEQLSEMQSDCRRITLRLMYAMDEELEKKDTVGFLDWLHLPWRYKLAPQDPPRKRPQSVPQLPPRPLDASGR